MGKASQIDVEIVREALAILGISGGGGGPISDPLIVTSSASGPARGPRLVLERANPDPQGNDFIGGIELVGRNSNGDPVLVGRLDTELVDTDLVGGEDGAFRLSVVIAGVLTEVLLIRDGGITLPQIPSLNALRTDPNGNVMGNGGIAMSEDGTPRGLVHTLNVVGATLTVGGGGFGTLTIPAGTVTITAAVELPGELPAAREAVRQRLRALRAPLLAQLDVAYMRALEDGDKPAQREVKQHKQELRDWPAHEAIEQAPSVEALEVVYQRLAADAQTA